ncbi:glycoside hydrolase family 32 protein [Microbacterium bovistercoris]|uniref:Glycoside hydrolase family 32 protein n=2 Tax=Microbacterium bovistercoris TaxID=2293570 RepID=A0A371NQN8_9MICO|nr:glycoside hydrolase family 32 protein [Microbacterium bovistercoris]
MTRAGLSAEEHVMTRPLVHFTPARNWMNDPNGLVFHDGRYHLFFQYNPQGTVHANMSWGHASSTDLVTWTEHPVAIPFDEHEQIFSGSAVVDTGNTAGFAGPGETALVAIYTSVSESTGIQSQALAYSVDDGETWTKYAGNPVLDRESTDFRDPKVFRYAGPAGEYWVMVAVEAVDRQVVLYRSDDLKQWSFLSAYGPAGAVDGIWECPDLFPLAVDGDLEDVRWVLVISLNPGGIAGGSGTQYVVGAFDGVTFTADQPPGSAEDADWLDHGPDCYAGVSFNGLPDDRRTLIAWMSNWEYARDWPDEGWRGAMTIARRLGLATVDGRPQLIAEPVVTAGAAVAPETDGSFALPGAARIDLTGVTGEVVLASEDGPRVVLRWSPDEVVFDRTSATAVPDPFPGVQRMPLPAEGMEALTLIVDRGSIEVFAADGARTLTCLVPWTGQIVLSASPGAEPGSIEVRSLT